MSIHSLVGVFVYHTREVLELAGSEGDSVVGRKRVLESRQCRDNARGRWVVACIETLCPYVVRFIYLSHRGGG